MRILNAGGLQLERQRANDWRLAELLYETGFFVFFVFLY